jgi:hypothetical protein
MCPEVEVMQPLLISNTGVYLPMLYLVIPLRYSTAGGMLLQQPGAGMDWLIGSTETKPGCDCGNPPLK